MFTVVFSRYYDSIFICSSRMTMAKDQLKSFVENAGDIGECDSVIESEHVKEWRFTKGPYVAYIVAEAI